MELEKARTAMAAYIKVEFGKLVELREVSVVRAAVGRADMIVDALFGTGLQGPLRGDYRILIEAVNSLEIPILAVDIPSGLDCDTGQPLGAAIRAACTVTFVAVKKGFQVGPETADYTGQVYVASIGVEPPHSPCR